jgi:RNA polymerase sigma-70 factor, ECF subfamily
VTLPHDKSTQKASASVPENRSRGGAAADGGASEEPPLDLEAVRARDPAALAALFERYFDRLYAMVYRMLGDRGAAEEALQEIFLKVHRGAPSLDPGRDPGPWLITIAANTVRDLWRSSAYRFERASSSLDADPGYTEKLASSAPDPERDTLTAERAEIVQRAIQSLKPSFREVVVLREYEGMSYDEIAAITGENATAVRKRYSRALDELGRYVTKAGL